MGFRLLADLVILFHLGFILFVLFGSGLVMRWIWVAGVHLPAIAWGIIVEWCHLECPLTYWENYYRFMAGQAMYAGGFIDRYVIAIIYPEWLTDRLQLLYGNLVAIVNIVMYTIAIRRWRRGRRQLRCQN